jgi:hypothetical protein
MGECGRPDRWHQPAAGTCHPHRLDGAYDHLDSYQRSKRRAAWLVRFPSTRRQIMAGDINFSAHQEARGKPNIFAYSASMRFLPGRRGKPRMHVMCRALRSLDSPLHGLLWVAETRAARNKRTIADRELIASGVTPLAFCALWPGFGGVGENVVDAVGETRSASDWSHHCDLSQRMPAPTPDPSPRDKKPVNKKQLAV